jgi:hypothetical protein
MSSRPGAANILYSASKQKSLFGANNSSCKSAKPVQIVDCADFSSALLYIVVVLL